MKKWIIIGVLLLIVGLGLFFGIRYYKQKKQAETNDAQFAATSGTLIGDRTVDDEGNITVSGVSNAPSRPDNSYFARVQYHFGSLSQFPEFSAKKAAVKKAGKQYCGAANEWTKKKCQSRNIPRVGGTWNRYKQRREYCLTPFMQVYGYKCDSECDS